MESNAAAPPPHKWLLSRESVYFRVSTADCWRILYYCPARQLIGLQCVQAVSGTRSAPQNAKCCFLGQQDCLPARCGKSPLYRSTEAQAALRHSCGLPQITQMSGRYLVISSNRVIPSHPLRSSTEAFQNLRSTAHFTRYDIMRLLYNLWHTVLTHPVQECI
jgi:hypothetical protein